MDGRSAPVFLTANEAAAHANKTVDGHSAPVFLTANEVAVQAIKRNAVFEKENAGVWNLCLMGKPLLAEKYCPFLSNKGGITPPWITTVDTVNGGVQGPAFQEMAKNFPVCLTPTRFPCPSLALRGSPDAKERDLFRFGVGGMGSGASISRMPATCQAQSSPFTMERDLFSFGVGGMGSGDLISRRMPASCQAQSNRFDVQISEVCQRRFVMFDRSGSKGRVIFHPELVNDLPALLFSSLPKSGAACILECPPYKISDARGCVVTASPFLPSRSPLGSDLLNHGPACLLLKNSLLDSNSSTPDYCDTPLLLNGENTKAKRHDGSPESSFYCKENSEDIEALLSSDEDEVSSTGHSPSDLSWNEMRSMCASKKRSRENENLFDEDDRCSSATSGLKICRGVTPEKGCDTGTNMSSCQDGLLAAREATTHLRDLGNGMGDLTAFDVLIPDEASSSSSANNQKGKNKLPSVQQQQQEGRCRREKIKSILRLLRGVIPGGEESLDAAFVLDDTIKYVKALEFEVQKLQAKKFHMSSHALL